MDTRRGPQGPGVGMVARWPRLAGCPSAVEWLEMLEDLGRAPRTVEAYARGVVDYLGFCDRAAVDVIAASRADVARYVGDLRSRPGRGGANVVAIDSGAGLANSTLRSRLVAVRLFYDFLVEERAVDRNPVGRGRYATGRNGRRTGGGERGLVPVFTRLPWIPTDEQWRAILAVAANGSLRNRLMLALAYDAGLRREELCLLETDDIDPAHRTLRIRAETTKTRTERVVPYSAIAGVLLGRYLAHRRSITRARGALLVSESRRNRGEPITPWTWSKVIRNVAKQAEVDSFSTHTLRHLCLTDLARSGWEVHAIAEFAGHRSTQTTMRYIHLSGRDLAARLESAMSHVHAQRVAQIGQVLG